MSQTLDSSPAAQAPRAGFLIRLVAGMIDLLILLPVYLLVAAALAVLDPYGQSPHADRLAGAALGAAWLAYMSTEIFKAATPGKMILKLRISWPDGTDADFWTLFLRWSTKHLPVMAWVLFLQTDFPAFWLLSGFSMLFVTVGCLYAGTEMRQTWHDQWSRTAVCHRRPVTSAAGVE